MKTYRQVRAARSTRIAVAVCIVAVVVTVATLVLNVVNIARADDGNEPATMGEQVAVVETFPPVVPVEPSESIAVAPQVQCSTVELDRERAKVARLKARVARLTAKAAR